MYRTLLDPMLTRNTSELRRSTRADVFWPVTVICKKSAQQGRVKNLGRGGALLYLQQQIALRERIRVAIETPKYDDVVLTVGEVVRILPLDRSIDNFAFAIRIRFTDISAESLKFLTDNLIQEVKKKDKEPKKKYHFLQVFKKNISYYAVALIILVIPLVYAVRENKVESSVADITAMEDRFGTFESRIRTLDETEASNRKTKVRIHDIKFELPEEKHNHEAMAKVAPLPKQVINNEKNFAKMSNIAMMEFKATPETDSSKEEPPPPDSANAVYHVVKKGENLYRISLKYSLNVDEIRKLNALPLDYSIHPGQKLLVR